MAYFGGVRCINHFGSFNPFGCCCNNIGFIRYISRITISDIIISTIFILIQFIQLYTQCMNNINTDIIPQNPKGAHKRINRTNDELFRDISLAFGHVSIANYALTLLFSQ